MTVQEFFEKFFMEGSAVHTVVFLTGGGESWTFTDEFVNKVVTDGLKNGAYKSLEDMAELLYVDDKYAYLGEKEVYEIKVIIPDLGLFRGSVVMVVSVGEPEN